MPSSARLPWRFDAGRLRADVDALVPDDWVPHFNTTYYAGDWSGAASVQWEAIRDGSIPIPPPVPPSQTRRSWPGAQGCRTPRAGFAVLLLAVRFLRLRPGSRIREHTDLALGFDAGEVRIHVPVSTDPEVVFLLDGRRVEMGEGEAWYLDLNLRHSVVNSGTAPRVHLVVDCVVDDWIRAILADARIGGGSVAA